MFYETIMRAADHIGVNRDRFDFDSADIPEGPHCGSPGCALGWIGFFGGVRSYLHIHAVAAALGTTEVGFYHRMDELEPNQEWREWYDDAAVCANTLRQYAEKYHGHERQVQELKASLRSLPETEAA